MLHFVMEVTRQPISLGDETASKAKYEDRADYMEGPGIDLMDDNRCAFARFCHREKRRCLAINGKI